MLMFKSPTNVIHDKELNVHVTLQVNIHNYIYKIQTNSHRLHFSHGTNWIKIMAAAGMKN